MSRPNLFKLQTWKSHERRVLEIFRKAMVRLKTQRGLPEREDDLNRRLFLLARKENYRLIRHGRGTYSNIYYEACNQPAADDIERSAREEKIPDFTCGFVDAQVGIDRFLALEGKRLGRPTSTNWVLNENYVKNGVRRFVNQEWAYGQDATSGAMVGYLQNMDPDAVLQEVNQWGKKHSLPAIVRSSPSRSPMQMKQTLTRTFPGSPFILRHFWVDLRRAGGTPQAMIAGKKIQ